MSNAPSQFAIALRSEVCASSNEHSIKAKRTPFGLFLDAVRNLHEQEVIRNMTGAAAWGGFPVVDVITYGLYVVIDKAAQKTDLSLSIESEALELFKRVNRLLSAGLTLEYSGVHAAAEAFKDQVTDVVLKAFDYGYQPGMSVSTRAWRAFQRGIHSELCQEIARQEVDSCGSIGSLGQVPAALFFTQLMRVARDERDALATLIERIEQENVAFSWRSGEALTKESDVNVDYIHFSRANSQMLLQFLDLNAPVSRSNVRSDESDEVVAQCSELLQARKLLQADLELVTLLQRMPHRLIGLARFLEEDNEFLSSDKVFPMSIASEWIEAQVAMAAANLSNDRDFMIGSQEYLASVRAAKKLSVDELVERFFQRMQERGLELTPAERSAMTDSFVRRAAVAARQRQLEVSDLVKDNGLLIIPVEEVSLEAESVLDFLCNNKGAPFIAGYDLLSEEAKCEYLRVQTRGVVDWSQIASEQFEQMVAGQNAPLSFLAEVVSQLNPAEQDEAVFYFFCARDLSETAVSHLLETGVVEFDIELLHQASRAVSPEIMREELPKLLERLTPQGRKISEAFAGETLARSLLQLHSEDLQQMLAGPRFRWHLSNWLVYDLLNEGHRFRADIRTRMTAQFSDELWQWYGVASSLVLREEQYSDHANPKVAYFPPWKDVSAYASPERLRMQDEAELSTFLEAHSEEELFRWVHEGLEDLEARWQEYVQNRKRFYALVKPDDE